MAALVANQACARHVQQTAGADALLRRLYAPYVAGDATVDPTGKPAPTLFDPHLTALLRRDRANAHGEIGALDSDPICACQDFGPLKALFIKVEPLGLRHARARVRFINLDAVTRLTYELTRTSAGWRISDIASPDMPSLVALLKAGTVRK